MAPKNFKIEDHKQISQNCRIRHTMILLTAKSHNISAAFSYEISVKRFLFLRKLSLANSDFQRLVFSAIERRKADEISMKMVTLNANKLVHLARICF